MTESILCYPDQLDSNPLSPEATFVVPWNSN